MARNASDTFLDGSLDVLISNGDLLVICSAEPTNLTEAVTTFALADVSLSGSDYTKANGDVSGRKVTIAAKSGIAVDTTGTATHVAIVDSGTELLYTTVCNSQGVSGGGTADTSSFDIEIRDPTAP
jgi:hypothetical protein